MAGCADAAKARQRRHNLDRCMFRRWRYRSGERGGRNRRGNVGFWAWVVWWAGLAVAWGAEVPRLTLAWNRNPEPDVVGYRLYYGFAPREYVWTNDVPGQATTATVALPLGGVTYHFAVTAYNDQGIESEYSDEIVHEAPTDGRPVDVIDLATVEVDEDAPAPLAGLDLPTEWRAVRGPYHGRLRGPTTELEYVPQQDFTGTDAFEFMAMVGESAVARIRGSVVVRPINDAPRVFDEELTVEAGNALETQLTAEDPDSPVVVLRITRWPKWGTLVTNDLPLVLYTPPPDYRGEDDFAYVANDGDLDSREATIRIVVQIPGGPPVAESLTVSLPEDTAVPIHLVASDPDGGPLQWEILDAPLHGTLSGNPPDLAYTPSPNFHGGDGFAFAVYDEDGLMAEALVSITVEPVNDPPEVGPLNGLAIEGLPAWVTLTGRDVDGDVLTFESVRLPAHGTLTPVSLPPGLTIFEYIAGPPASGTDSFTYRAQDGEEASSEGTVNFTLLAADAAAPRVESRLVEGGRLELRWTTLPGAGYAVCFRRAEASAIWERVGSTLVGRGEELVWTTEFPGDGVAGFFRVQVLGTALGEMPVSEIAAARAP